MTLAYLLLAFAIPVHQPAPTEGVWRLVADKSQLANPMQRLVLEVTCDQDRLEAVMISIGAHGMSVDRLAFPGNCAEATGTSNGVLELVAPTGNEEWRLAGDQLIIERKPSPAVPPERLVFVRANPME